MLYGKKCVGVPRVSQQIYFPPNLQKQTKKIREKESKSTPEILKTTSSRALKNRQKDCFRTKLRQTAIN